MTRATALLNIVFLLSVTQAFLAPSPTFEAHTRLLAKKNRHHDEPSFLMKEFSTVRGEVVNPYKTLRVGRSASRQEIKKSYYKLSRKYHPDGFRNQSILPGHCNSVQDMLDHWERIRLSYEILSTPKIRQRYDRHEFFADPGTALQRAAWNAMGNGLEQIGRGCITFGIFAVRHMVQDTAIIATALLSEQTKKESHLEELVKQGVAGSVRAGLMTLESSFAGASKMLSLQPLSFAADQRRGKQQWIWDQTATTGLH